jgi:Tir chaperone protein (CesT) family
MDGAERVALILQEVGARDDGIKEISAAGEAGWIVRFDEVEIEVEFDPQTQRLMVSSEIGTPPEELRVQMYEAVLLYSMLWRDTGGLRMAMSESGGPITQMVDLHLSSLTTPVLATVLRNLAEKTLIWRKYINGTDEAPPEPMPYDQRLIRV